MYDKVSYMNFMVLFFRNHIKLNKKKLWKICQKLSENALTLFNQSSAFYFVVFIFYLFHLTIFSSDLLS